MGGVLWITESWNSKDLRRNPRLNLDGKASKVTKFQKGTVLDPSWYKTLSGSVAPSASPSESEAAHHPNGDSVGGRLSIIVRLSILKAPG